MTPEKRNIIHAALGQRVNRWCPEKWPFGVTATLHRFGWTFCLCLAKREFCIRGQLWVTDLKLKKKKHCVTTPKCVQNNVLGVLNHPWVAVLPFFSLTSAATRHRKCHNCVKQIRAGLFVCWTKFHLSPDVYDLGSVQLVGFRLTFLLSYRKTMPRCPNIRFWNAWWGEWISSDLHAFTEGFACASSLCSFWKE